MKGLSLDLGELSKFTLLASPVISSVTTDNVLAASVARPGDKLLIKGEGLQGSSLTDATFGGQALKDVQVVSDALITATLPEGVAIGEDVVTLRFEGVEVDVKSTDKLNVIGAGSDITQYVLKNSVQPFAVASSEGSLGAPADWMVNDAAKNCKKNGGNGIIQNVGDKSTLSVQAGWDFKNMSNGKIYQSVKLPAGKYNFTVDVAECGQNSGRFCVFFVVSTKSELPDINISNKTLANEEGVLASYRITDNKSAHTKELPVTVEEGMTGTAGIVAELSNQGWCKLSGIRVYVVE